MRITFTFYDVKEISVVAFRTFISTLLYDSDQSDSNSVPNDFDSDLSDLDPHTFGCGEITPQVENMVENSWEICDPLEEVYGTTTSNLIK